MSSVFWTRADCAAGGKRGFCVTPCFAKNYAARRAPVGPLLRPSGRWGSRRPQHGDRRRRSFDPSAGGASIDGTAGTFRSRGSTTSTTLRGKWTRRHATGRRVPYAATRGTVAASTADGASGSEHATNHCAPSTSWLWPRDDVSILASALRAGHISTVRWHVRPSFVRIQSVSANPSPRRVDEPRRVNEASDARQ